MSRPVYNIDTTVEPCDLVSKEPWIVECRMSPQDQAHLHKPRSMVSTKQGFFRLENLKISVLPGPPVDGKLLVQIEGDKF